MAKFVPRIRKHKVRERLKRQQQASTQQYQGADTSTPPESEQRTQRRQQLKLELRSNQASAISSKKKKRLDKYIETKLKKEENQELIKKLSQQNVDRSLLRSSKRLGQGHDTKREVLSQALRKHRAGVSNEIDHGVLFDERLDESDSSREPEVVPSSPEQSAISNHLLDVPAKEAQSESFKFGTGLKRPLEISEDGNPIIQQRKRRKRLKKQPTSLIENVSPPPESDWEGLSSGVNGSQDENESDRDSEAAAASEEDDFSNSEDPESSESEDNFLRERSSAFKAWATSQRHDASEFKPIHGYIPNAQPPSEERQGPAEQAPQVDQAKVLPLHASDRVNGSRRKAYHVPVTRPADVDMSRQNLPVVAKEQEIMEAIFDNDICILTGATGSGKTTQVPQFLFEAGFGDPKSPTPGMVGVTQPRRVAAVSMAKRVAYELNDANNRVSHQIRFDSSVGDQTAVKFMTDGVLLREVSKDFTLAKYSAVIIDEAHERSVNTDILIGMLSRVAETRRKLAQQKDSKFRPLKVIIMSATLRIGELVNNKFLFREQAPPVLDVEGKQFDVTAHFARRTHGDYVEEMFQKVRRGHRKLPPGGILVFLTGQNEIEYLERRLKSEFTSTEQKTPPSRKMRVSAQSETVELDDVHIDSRSSMSAGQEVGDVVAGLDFDDDAEEDEFNLPDEEDSGFMQRVHVLPLYSQLPSDLQARVFEEPPANSRLIILSTNVSETSLTIPNIRYVFDCGRQKSKHYNPRTGIQSFAIDWISKASAQQRTGRAGRTGPGGHCYRLYSSAVYEDAFPEFSEPEITQTPVEGVVLTLKSMGLTDVTRFPFPTPLDPFNLRQAEMLLQYLGALDPITGHASPLGKQLSLYPLSPRLARILVLAQREPRLLQHAITLVAALGVSELFVPQSALGFSLDARPIRADDNDEDVWRDAEADVEAATLQEQRRKDYAAFHSHMVRLDTKSDGIKLLTTLADFSAHVADQRGISQGTTPANHFRTFTRTKALHEALQLRGQLTSLASLHTGSAIPQTQPPAVLTLPTLPQVKTLRFLLAAGYINNMAQRADLSPMPPRSTSHKHTSATQVPYIPLFSTTGVSPSDLARLDDRAKDRLTYTYIHPSSVLAHTSPTRLPQYIIYSHLSTSGTTLEQGSLPPRTRIHPLTPASAATLLELTRGTPLLAEGKPVGKIETLPRGDGGEERRAVYCVPFLRGDEGREWPLGSARRVVQKRVLRRGWVVESGGVALSGGE